MAGPLAQRGKQCEGNTMLPEEEILSCMLRNLYQLQSAAVTNCHYPPALNYRNLFSHNPGGQKSGMCFSGLKSAVRAAFSLEAGGVSLLSASSSFWGLPCFLACGHFTPVSPCLHLALSSSVWVKSPSASLIRMQVIAFGAHVDHPG